MNLIIEKSQSPSHNLAREEVLLGHVKEDTVYLWRNRPSVIVGRHQNTLAEVDSEAAAKHRIEIVRRLTGGGAVFHDHGNINFSFIFPGGDFDEKAALGLQMIISYLQSRGAACFANGRNDVCMKDSGGNVVKISGTAMTQREDRGIFHGCVLFDCDLAAMAQVLTPKKEKLISKGVASVRSRVSNLRALVPALHNLSADQFFADWGRQLAESCTTVKENSADEAAEIAKLVADRYENPVWNFGRNPACSMEISRRFQTGTVEFHADIKGNIIGRCWFSGDYLTMADFGVLAERLQGTAFAPDAIEEALEEVDLIPYFGRENRKVIIDFLSGRSEDSWHLS